MKIILLKDVRNVGNKDDIKEVSDGYARNFLFVNNFAKLATPVAIKEVEKLKSELHKHDAELKKHLEELARKINDTSIEFSLKADEKGSIFGSVNKDAILKSLREHKLINQERVEIELDHPIKEIGTHQVKVDLKRGIEAKLGVIIVRQQT